MAINAGPKIVEDGLILCLDAANKKSYPRTGTVWTDLTANKKTGTLTNMDGSNFTNQKAGLLSFDGTNEYVLGSSNLGLSGDPDFSIAYWGYWNDTSFSSNYPSGFGNNTTGTSNGLSTTWRQGRIALDVWHYRFRASSALTVKTWFYVAFTKVSGSLNATNSKLYVNGDNVSGSTENGTAVNITDSSFVVGRLDGSRYFKGYVNCISVYNRVLTPDEIKKNYNSTKWRFQ